MAEKIIINAENGILGRLASYAAKQALQGAEISVVNCEKAVITGNKKDIIQKYKVLRAKGGHSQKGPKVSKTPYRLVKRVIRGMLPNHRGGIGKQALGRIRCYNDIPDEFKDQKMEKMPSPKTSKYIELKELSEKL